MNCSIRESKQQSNCSILNTNCKESNQVSNSNRNTNRKESNQVSSSNRNTNRKESNQVSSSIRDTSRKEIPDYQSTSYHETNRSEIRQTTGSKDKRETASSKVQNNMRDSNMVKGCPLTPSRPVSRY